MIFVINRSNSFTPFHVANCSHSFVLSDCKTLRYDLNVEPHTVIPSVKCGSIRELYNIHNVFDETILLSLNKIPTPLDILFCLLFICFLKLS